MLFFSRGPLASPPPLDNARFEARWPASSGKRGDWAAFLQGPAAGGATGREQVWGGGPRRMKSHKGTIPPPPGLPQRQGLRTWGWAAGQRDMTGFDFCFLYPSPTQTFYFDTRLRILGFPTSWPLLLVTWFMVFNI